MTQQNADGYARGGKPPVPGTDAAIRRARWLEQFELYVELYGPPVHIEYHKAVPEGGTRDDSGTPGTDQNS